MIINISAGKDNFSQRNNEVKPLESCNVTSMVMALSYMGYAFPPGPYQQPEDNLYTFIKQNGRNPEVHAELSDMTNKWMNKNVTKFSTAFLISNILSELKGGRPVVLSGTFPGYPAPKKTPLGHIVCLVGMDITGTVPDHFIWDDPYGNTLNDWQGSGNDIKVSYAQFINWIKPVGNTSLKWAHTFMR